MRIIKRYANRKLYDTSTSQYVTLASIGDLLSTGEELQVLCNKTLEYNKGVTAGTVGGPDAKLLNPDITIQTIALIIAADQATGNPKYPVTLNDLDRLLVSSPLRNVQRGFSTDQADDARQGAALEKIDNMLSDFGS